MHFFCRSLSPVFFAILGCCSPSLYGSGLLLGGSSDSLDSLTALNTRTQIGITAQALSQHAASAIVMRNFAMGERTVDVSIFRSAATTFSLQERMVGLYQGHGGVQCSQFLAMHFSDLAAKTIAAEDRPAVGMLRALQIVERESQQADLISDASGSTLAAATIYDNTLIVGNVGDTQIYLKTPNHPTQILSVADSLQSLAERNRLRSAGLIQQASYFGDVFGAIRHHMERSVGYEFYAEQFPCNKVPVSRSIGDSYLKSLFPKTLQAMPHVLAIPAPPAGSFLVLFTRPTKNTQVFFDLAQAAENAARRSCCDSNPAQQIAYAVEANLGKIYIIVVKF
jgi:serine/threonine protein phosphatase PrpC